MVRVNSVTLLRRRINLTPAKVKKATRTVTNSPVSLLALPHDILHLVVGLLPTQPLLRLGQTCKEFLHFSDALNPRPSFIVIPFINEEDLHEDDLSQYTRETASKLGQLGLQALQRPESASRIRELHIITTPPGAATIPGHLKENIYTETLNNIELVRGLRCLRIDIASVHLGKNVLQTLPCLVEMQITPYQVEDIRGLSVQKLTVIHYVTSGSIAPKFTVKDLPDLSRLYLAAGESFDMSVPLFDFGSLPRLSYLALRQGRPHRYTGLPGWEVKSCGSPTSLTVLSLNTTTVTPQFLQSCKNLHHLHLVRVGQELPLFQLPHLEVLELVDCHPNVIDRLQNSQMPALKHFFEYTDRASLGNRMENPLAFLGNQPERLETVIAICRYNWTRGPQYEETGNLKNELENMKKYHVLQNAAVFSNIQEHVQCSWGTWYAGSLLKPKVFFNGRDCDVVVTKDIADRVAMTDPHRHFIQTRIGLFLNTMWPKERKFVKRLHRSPIPLDWRHYDTPVFDEWDWAPSVRDIWCWARRLDRASFMYEANLFSKDGRYIT